MALSWRSHNLTTSNSACVRASATVLEDVDDPAVRDADGDLAAKPGSGAWPKPGSDAKASWVPIIRHCGEHRHGSGTIYAQECHHSLSPPLQEPFCDEIPIMATEATLPFWVNLSIGRLLTFRLHPIKQHR